MESLSSGRAWARRMASGSGADPDLPILATLRDPAGAAEWWLRRAGHRLGLDSRRLHEVEILRYRPGRRCTFRFCFGDPAPRRVYVKVYGFGRARRAARLLNRLAGLGPWPDLRLPSVLAVVPEDGAVILEEVDGTPFDERLAAAAEAGSDPLEVARAILRLHSLQVPGVRAWTAADELAVLEARRAGFGRHAGADARHADDLYRRIRALAPVLDSIPRALLHRDLHPQQILLDGRSAGLVDLDDLARGPAEIDVGNLLAHLDLLTLHLPPDSARIAEAGRRIEAAYERARPLSPLALRVSRAASLLRLVGIYASAHALPDLPPRLLDRAAIVLGAEDRP